MKKSNLVFISMIILFSLNVVLVKADLVITVKYSGGCPVEGATVRVYKSESLIDEVCTGNTNKNGQITCKPPEEVPICPHTYTFKVEINGEEKDIGPVDVDGTCTGSKTSNLADYCPSGHCVDGYCCNSACSGTCEACNLTSHEGTCTYIPNGQDPNNECSATLCLDSCNIDSNPFTFDYANDQPNYCTGFGSCTSNACIYNHACADPFTADNIFLWDSTIRICTAECDQNSDCKSNICKSDCTCEPPTCGLSANNINFDSVNPGETSTDQTANLQNTGNSPTDTLTIEGTVWTGTPSGSMIVGQTSVNDGTWKTLTASPGITIYNGIINNGETKHPQFKVAIPNGQVAASYSQTITFTGGC
jgi:hypothetical protein